MEAEQLAAKAQNEYYEHTATASAHLHEGRQLFGQKRFSGALVAFGQGLSVSLGLRTHDGSSDDELMVRNWPAVCDIATISEYFMSDFDERLCMCSAIDGILRCGRKSARCTT